MATRNEIVFYPTLRLAPAKCPLVESRREKTIGGNTLELKIL